MSDKQPDIRSRRLNSEQLRDNFSDLHPPLEPAEALVEADRCYFCFDAPCTTACPTGIDIPQFIQRIRSNNLEGAAHSILSENIMGGMCARVCPTEVLCEEVCVRNVHGDKPVEIGLLQRHATDPTLNAGKQLFTRANPTGNRIAVVGAGPAGLSCAHRLAVLGNDVVVFEHRHRPGGLNEHGIAAYKTVDEFAQREVEYILAIGGIELRALESLNDAGSLAALQDEFDAVFLGIGLGGVNVLGIEGEDDADLEDAVHYIENLRQAPDLGDLPVGRRVLVIGGGMTAIDIAVQSRRLGAEAVDMVYRRGNQQMGASDKERRFAQTEGVKLHTWARPVKILQGNGPGVRFERTTVDSTGSLSGTGETFDLYADVIFRAVGQQMDSTLEGLDRLERNRGSLKVDENGRTSLAGVWAGGDCVDRGENLTVTAVEHGKRAAMDMHQSLSGGN